MVQVLEAKVLLYLIALPTHMPYCYHWSFWGRMVEEVGWGATERNLHEICSLVQKMRGKNPVPWRQCKFRTKLQALDLFKEGNKGY